MIYIVILNFVGIIGRMMESRVLMYAAAYISAISFCHRYAGIVWKIIYEPSSGAAENAELVDRKLMNLVSVFIIMTSIFFFICFEFDGFCVPVSILQCVVFQAVNLYKNRTGTNLTVLIMVFVEFLLAASMQIA